MRLRLTSAANAGIICNIGDLSIWCDVLHNVRVQGFSTLTKERLEQLIKSDGFTPPSLLFYTHCRHFDHYSESLNKEFLERYPYTLAAAPRRLRETDIVISGERQRMKLRDVSLEFIRLTHEGEQFKEIPHYGCMISHGGEQILMVGDCKLCSDELRDYVRDKHTDVLIAPFSWITLAKGREFIDTYIKPKHIIVNHLPLEADDLYGYREAAVRCAGKVKASQVHICMEMLQEVTIEYEQYNLLSGDIKHRPGLQSRFRGDSFAAPDGGLIPYPVAE